jgi:gamma-glutamyltranspeptidase/glutathione hydrolase
LPVFKHIVFHFLLKNLSPLEGRFPEATVEALRKRGHAIEIRDDWSLGRVSAAAKDGPLLKAGADPRQRQGYAIGR